MFRTLSKLVLIFFSSVCDCDPFGSSDLTCDRDTGVCSCKPHYTGRKCDRCEVGCRVFLKHFNILNFIKGRNVNK